MKTTKIPFSESNGWRGIGITQVATVGDLIHTAIADSAGRDEIWLWATNTGVGGAVAVTMTFEFGGVTAPDDLVVIEVPLNTTIPVFQGRVLDTGALLTVFDSSGGDANVWGYVNRMTDD